MKKKELLVVSIGIFLTIIAWMIADLYHIRKSVIINDVVSEAHVPTYKINPTVFIILKDRVP